MRVFLAVKRRAEAEALLERMPGAQILHPDTATAQIQHFRSGEISTLVGLGQFSVCGYRLPSDTVLLLGQGWSEAEELQLRARVSPFELDLPAPRTVSIGPGTLVGIDDRLGRPIHIGDTLVFDPSVWRGACRFTITWEDGELQHPGCTSDLTEFCTVVETWDGRAV